MPQKVGLIILIIWWIRASLLASALVLVPPTSRGRRGRRRGSTGHAERLLLNKRRPNKRMLELLTKTGGTMLQFQTGCRRCTHATVSKPRTVNIQNWKACLLQKHTHAAAERSLVASETALSKVTSRFIKLSYIFLLCFYRDMIFLALPKRGFPQLASDNKPQVFQALSPQP